MWDFLPVILGRVDLTPFATTLSKGLEKICLLTFGKYLDNRQAHAAYAKAQSEKNVQKILNGEVIYENGRLYAVLPEPQIDSLPDMLALHTKWQEVENLMACLRSAASQISVIPDDSIPDEDISQNWFLRWRHEASMVTEEVMRDFLAKILVGEVQQPGRISLRTLDTVKNLDQKEFQTFIHLARFAVDERIPQPDLNYVVPPDVDLPFDGKEIRLLQEAGLLNESEKPTGEYDPKDPYVDFVRDHDVLRFFLEASGSLQSIFSGNMFTRAAKELLPLLEIPPVDNDVLRYFHECIRHSYPRALKGIHAYPVRQDGSADVSSPLCTFTPPASPTA